METITDNIPEKDMFTKEQRLEIYKDLLNLLNECGEENPGIIGFCVLLNRIPAILTLKRKEFKFNDIIIEKYLPELYAHKPSLLYHGFWFPIAKKSLYKRIDILKEIIDNWTF